MKRPTDTEAYRPKQAKIIPFPRVPDETHGQLLRGLLKQSFPTDTWERLREDRTTQLRARILIQRIFKPFDRYRQMAFLLEALPFGPHENRRLAKAIIGTK